MFNDTTIGIAFAALVIICLGALIIGFEVDELRRNR